MPVAEGIGGGAIGEEIGAERRLLIRKISGARNQDS
jgi:hypothetical protein